MNTKTDETLLARWLDDDLGEAEASAFAETARAHPEWLERRRVARAMKADFAALIPASGEPPYPDFFNGRVMAAIRREPTPAARGGWSAGRWWLPAAAAAGMAVAFWTGLQTGTGRAAAVAHVPEPVASSAPAGATAGIYTPERGVDATLVPAKGAGATVIVLEGVNAIPDDTELSRTAKIREDHPDASGRKDKPEGEWTL